MILLALLPVVDCNAAWAMLEALPGVLRGMCKKVLPGEAADKLQQMTARSGVSGKTSVPFLKGGAR